MHVAHVFHFSPLFHLFLGSPSFSQKINYVKVAAVLEKDSWEGTHHLVRILFGLVLRLRSEY